MRRFRIVLICTCVLMTAALFAAWLAYHASDRMPGELLRYAERRLSGHNKIEAVALPVIAQLRIRIERPVPANLPTLGKGAQARQLLPVIYDNGRPMGVASEGEAAQGTVSVASLDELQRAMHAARPGDVIELLPGRYAMQRSLTTPVAGAPGLPITVRAAVPLRTEILSSTLEGFVINRPYWVFENLVIRGVCRDDGDCEHAFHVIGGARGTVIRNNRIEDFNAQLKINGARGEYPDDGLAQFNTLENTRPRATPKPVTTIDLVGASRWIYADNVVANFHKAQGDGISYGLFMKGGGSDGRIERNLVICSRTEVSARGSGPGTGARVGISLGGGGTGAGYCRSPQCEAEHLHGLVANNVVAHCNDVGIDVNGAADSTVVHNTLVNTAGIDVRNAPASASVLGNWLEGKIRARNDAWMETTGNRLGSLDEFVASTDALALTWAGPPPPLISSAAPASRDFCKRQRGAEAPPGAIATPGLPCAHTPDVIPVR